MSLETILARLFVDLEFREAFLRSPESCAGFKELSAIDRQALMDMDRPGLLLAARSVAAKCAPPAGALRRLRQGIGRLGQPRQRS